MQGGWRILDHDLAQPLPEVVFAPGEEGLALILRDGGRLVGYLLEPRAGRPRLGAAELAGPVARETATRVIAGRLRGPRPAGRMPSVTVAICTRNRPESLARCLASLAALDPSPEELAEGFEVLVVDNAPPDDRTRLAAEAAGVRYAMEPRPGLNFGRNRALAEARHAILAFVDDDVVVDRGWLAGLHEAWSENPDARGFTGLVLPYALETPAQVLFERRGGFRRGLDKIRHRRERADNPLWPCGAGSFGAGANMAFDRATLLALGGFDEALDTGAPLPGGGDLDIFYRVARTGEPFIYEPQFCVFHEHRQDLPGLQRQYWTWGTAHMAFVEKSWRSDPAYRGRFARLVAWWFQDQARQLARALLGRHVLPAGMVWAELRGGIQGLFGEYGRSQRRVRRIREAHP